MSAANVNDGSCMYDPSYVTPLASFQLGDSLSETSGLIIWEGLGWTHNDNTDTRLYGLDLSDARIEESINLPGVENLDWEEISQDSSFIYVGDFGNNESGNRTDLHILKVAKHSLISGFPAIDTIHFSYSDQPKPESIGPNKTDFDCEAFVVSSDSIYLFTKQWFGSGTSVYRLPKEPGVYLAEKRDACHIEGMITGAVLLESERLLVLCGYNKLVSPFFYLLYDFEDQDFFAANRRKLGILLPFHQVEGIASADGIHYYVSNESFSPHAMIKNPQKLHHFDLSEYLQKYLD